jgi:hypothetical protein
MKDKRQRMAFAWPYGDPQMLAYMISAVAATSGYGSSASSTTAIQSIQQNLAGNHCEMNKHFSSIDASNRTASSSKPKSTHSNNNSVMSSKLSPNSSRPLSSCSSTSSNFVSSNTQQVDQAESQQQQMKHPHLSYNSSTSSSSIPLGLTSPISLYIPNNSNPNQQIVYQNMKLNNNQNELNDLSLNQLNSLISKSVQHQHQQSPIVGAPVSFKSPAFGLANIEQASLFHNHHLHLNHHQQSSSSQAYAQYLQPTCTS